MLQIYLHTLRLLKKSLLVTRLLVVCVDVYGGRSHLLNLRSLCKINYGIGNSDRGASAFVFDRV